MLEVETAEVAEEVDINEVQVPGWAKDGTEDDDLVVAGEDVSGAQPFERSDVIDAAKGVEVYIKGIPTLDKYTPQGQSEWQKISMRPVLVVGEKGVDGKGKYKNKHLFPRILIAVNREAYAEQFSGKFYAPRDGGAFGDYRMFLEKQGFPINPAPTNDKPFRQSLENRKLIIDITKDKRRVFDDAQKKWVNSDEYENNIVYRGVPKAAVAAPEAETAAA